MEPGPTALCSCRNAAALIPWTPCCVRTRCCAHTFSQKLPVALTNTDPSTPVHAFSSGCCVANSYPATTTHGLTIASDSLLSSLGWSTVAIVIS